MRWVVSGLLAVVAAWGLYVASPYFALYRLGQAVEAGNVAEVAAMVNERALRHSLAKQIAGELAAADRSGSGIASADAELAAGAAVALADPVIADLVSPEGLVKLLRVPPSGTGPGSAFGDDPVDLDDVDDFLGASSWRGFRTVYFHLPPGAPAASRFRLQLRLGNLRWRVVALELPPGLRRRIAADLLKRVTR